MVRLWLWLVSMVFDCECDRIAANLMVQTIRQVQMIVTVLLLLDLNQDWTGMRSLISNG